MHPTKTLELVLGDVGMYIDPVKNVAVDCIRNGLKAAGVAEKKAEEMEIITCRIRRKDFITYVEWRNPGHWF